MSGEVLQDLYMLALTQCLDAVVFIDDKNNVIFYNDAAERLWGFPRAEVLGQNVAMLVPLQWRAQHDDLVDTHRRTGVDRIVGTTRDVPIKRADGSPAWGQLALSRARIGDLSFYAAFVREITDEVRRREQLRLLSLASETTGQMVIVTDACCNALYINHAFTEMFGYPAQEVLGKVPFTLLLKDGKAEGFADHLIERLTQVPGFTEEVLFYGRSGKGVWVSATFNRAKDSVTGEFANMVAVLADITQSKQIEELQRDVLATVVSGRPLDDVADLICRRVEAIAPGVVCSLIGVSDDGLLQPLAAPSMPESFNAALSGLAIGPLVGSCGSSAYLGEPVLVEDIATSPLWEDFRWLPLPEGLNACWSVPIKLRSGRVAGTFAFYFRDRRVPSPWHEQIVSAVIHLCALTLEREEARHHIARLASYDTLTGLPNRIEFLHLLEEQLKGCSELNVPLALLFVDLDHFKDVNDTLGHSTGDQLLVEMSRRLKAQLRSGDMVGRIGADEFVVLIHNCAAEEADRIARRLLEYLSAPVTAQALNLAMSASIGIAMFPEHGGSAEELLKHADTALHEAKRKGRGKAQFFTEDLNQRVQNRLVLSVALREAINSNALTLVYQPQVSLSTGALHGLEALARRRDPLHGDVPAPRFIALAEEYGLIESLDVWAVEEACRQIARWRAEGVPVPHVSVNFSPPTFRSGEIAGIVSGALLKHGLQPSDLMVEITERVTMDQHPNSFAAARSIEALGVRLAMDDFGTGYSSLSALSRLPIAELKIDRSFMLSIEQDHNAQALATAVIRIGHSLGMTVVAEGVETSAQVNLLKSLGCHAAQGYHFARPLASGDVAPWLAALH